MNKSNYKITKIEDGIVFLVDLGGNFKSVTNDAENVYAEVISLYPNHRVVYKDTLGSWDEIIVQNGILKFLNYEKL